MLYIIPDEFAFTYALAITRTLLLSIVIAYILGLPYSILIAIIAILIADYHFYMNFNMLVEATENTDENSSDEDSNS